jgi:serine phosphatase RsbU (regulator of sigma subunit)
VAAPRPAGGGAGPGPGAALGAALAAVLAGAGAAEPDSLGDLLAAASQPVGISGVRIYLADIQQVHLYPLAGGTAPPGDALAIDGTLAGRAYQTAAVQHAPAGTGAPAGPGDDAGAAVTRPGGAAAPAQLWVPLLNGAERLGVLEFTAADAGPATVARCQALGSLAGLLVASKSDCSDAYARTRRSQPVALQAELVHAFTPPPAFGTADVSVAAVLEPAYEVGGDAFDYSLLGDRMQVTVLDAAGHDLVAGLLASVALAACRGARRSGGSLADMARHADRAIAGQFADLRFATALLCDLNTATGEFTWIPCGHPPPLLIRDGKVIKELAREALLPLGLGRLGSAPPGTGRPGGPPPAPCSEQLQRGDRILLYTDGVTEGRGTDGSQFGLDRLSDFVIRTTATGLPAPEVLRRLDRVILDFQDGRLSDDATIVLLDWAPGGGPQRAAR